MRWWTVARLRVRSLLRRDDADRELDAELRFHLEEQIAEHTAAGMDRAEARRRALMAIGGHARIVEECRDARGVGLIEAIANDARFGVRMLAKHRAFTATTVLTLAVGIGFTTLAFSTGRSLLFGALPLDEPDRLVLGEALREGFDPGGTSLLEYGVVRQVKAFSHSAASIDRELLLRGRTEVEQLHAAAVTPGFFDTLGTRPAIGRLLTTDESRPGGPPAVLISYAFWARRFGSDAAALGQTLDLDGRNYTIVGIMPKGFDYPTRTQAWIALDVDPDTAALPVRTLHGYIFVARLRPGISRAEAAGEARQIIRGLDGQFPSERGWSYGLLTMRQWSIGDDDGRITSAIVVLLIAIGVLLIICCVNVANLLLVRGVVRQRELAIRIGLGASSGRVVQQLLTEGALLSLFGGLAGLLLAWMVQPIFLMLNPIEPHAFADVVTDFPIDWRVLAFCLAASTASGLLFTLLPALKLAYAGNPIDTLRHRERRAGGAADRRWLRAFVVAEIAIALSLSFGGALLTRSFFNLGGLDLGFRPQHLLTMQLPLSAIEYSEQTDRIAFMERVLARVRALPGVDGAGFTSALPMQPFSPDTAFIVEGHPAPNPDDIPVASIRHVSPGYAETLGLTLIKGRLPVEGDRADTLRVAVITEELAREAFGNDDPIGQRLRRGRVQDTNFPWMTVVGVVRDAKEDRLNFRIARPALYVPDAQRVNPPSSAVAGLVVRVSGEPSAAATSVRAAIREVNPYQPVAEVSTMDAMVNGVLSAHRFSARMMALLAAVGLFVAAIGLYSVVAYSVTQRTGEIGLRVALGAQPGAIVRMIAGEVALMVALAMAVSVPGLLAVARLLSEVLFSVNATDPAILAALVAVITAIAAAAAFAPARRAMALDPVQALQHE